MIARGFIPRALAPSGFRRTWNEGGRDDALGVQAMLDRGEPIEDVHVVLRQRVFLKSGFILSRAFFDLFGDSGMTYNAESSGTVCGCEFYARGSR